MRRPPPSSESYAPFTQLLPANVVALNNLAYLLALNGGSQAEALALIQRAIDQAGPDPEMLDTRALVYLKGGQADRAGKDLRPDAQLPRRQVFAYGTQ